MEKVRVLSYSRVSSASQNIRSQEEQLEAMIASKPDWTLVEHFSDEAYSGDNFSTRQGFKKLIQKAKAGEADLIACFSLSRIGRSLSQVIATICDLTDNHGVAVYSMSENLLCDGKSASGKLVLAVYSALNELNLEMIRSSVRSGVERRRKEILEDGGHWGRPFKSIDVGLLTQLRYEKKVSYRKIAQRLGCGVSTVCRRLKEIEVYHKPTTSNEHNT